MDTKKKIIISVSAFVLVLVATVVAVVSVLAAQSVSVSSNVSISYTAGANVIGSMEISAKTENNTVIQIGGANTKTITFTGTETGSAAAPEANFSNATLASGSNNFVTYTFKFTNTSTVAGYTANLYFRDGGSGDGTITNMKFYKDGTLTSCPSSDVPLTVTVAKGGNVTLNLKVEIDDPLKDSAFSGVFYWELVAAR